jgi:hypothetical protein
MLRALLPRPGYLDGGTEAYVLNVYTNRRPPARPRPPGDGRDHRLVRRRARLAHQPARVGRRPPLYEALGAATNEMRRDTVSGAA